MLCCVIHGWLWCSRAISPLNAQLTLVWYSGGARSGKLRGGSRDHSSEAPCREPVVPQSQSDAWQDSILATSQAISRRWGSDGRMGEWSSDCDKPRQSSGPAGNRHRRRMSDTAGLSDWSKSAQASDKLDRLYCLHSLFKNVSAIYWILCKLGWVGLSFGQTVFVHFLNVLLWINM